MKSVICYWASSLGLVRGQAESTKAGQVDPGGA